MSHVKEQVSPRLATPSPPRLQLISPLSGAVSSEHVTATCIKQQLQELLNYTLLQHQSSIILIQY